MLGWRRNPLQARAELDAAAASRGPGQGYGEIIPGSMPQTGALTGDPGLLSASRAVATEYPDLYQQNQFRAGASQQNAARVSALQGLQSAGDPAAVANAVRQNLADIEFSMTMLCRAALAAAKTKGSSVGTGASPEAIGAAIREPLVRPLAPLLRQRKTHFGER